MKSIPITLEELENTPPDKISKKGEPYRIGGNGPLVIDVVFKED